MSRPILILLATGFTLAGPLAARPAADVAPWRAAGLSERQAAAHLLDRLAFGARPGDVDRVESMGIAAWLDAQLHGELDDEDVAQRLASFDSLSLSLSETIARYPGPGLVYFQMRRDGALPDGMGDPGARDGMDGEDRMSLRAALVDYGREKGYRPQRELIGQLFAHKLLRALYSENQLHEVLTDFWFNHFNVSLTDNEARPYIGLFERDAIRRHVTGRFRDMLGATARHPAMLLYLDNARSVAPDDVATTFDAEAARQRFARRSGRRGDAFRRRGPATDRPPAGRRSPAGDELLARLRPTGLNENYARELLELHTLGVAGGYSQQDVVEVARAFTGWTNEPPRMLVDATAARRLGFARRLPPSAGFVFEEGFLFRADVHDAEAKSVLGTPLPAGRGIEDGEAVLDLLAAHPATARHLARKLAIRFVADEPPAPLVDALAATFRRTGGDLAAILETLVFSDAFWSPEARRQKIKSPFELAASALRALDAEVARPRAVLEWIGRMGQPLYAYQAPTGFPDNAEAWVNTGSLVARMSFAMQLASGQVAGVRFDLAALDGGREPASLDDALSTYVPLLLPERDAEATIRQLEPTIRDPELATKLARETPDEPASRSWLDLAFAPGDDAPRGRRGRRAADRRSEPLPPTTGPLGHVVGVILGSPEFQRR